MSDEIIKYIEPTDPENKNIRKIESINEIPTFEIESEEEIFFKAVVEQASNKQPSREEVKWVWAWYNNGTISDWGMWERKSEEGVAVSKKNLKDYTLGTPSVTFSDNDIGKIAWLEAFVRTPEGPEGKESKGALLKIKAYPKITDVNLLFLGKPYIKENLLAYDQHISVEIGIYNKADFGELVIEVWDKNKTKKISQKKITLNTIPGLQLYLSDHKQNKTEYIEYITDHILIKNEWREEIKHAKGTLVEYVLHIQAIPIRYTKAYEDRKAFESTHIYGGDISYRGSKNVRRLKDESEKDRIKNDYAENVKRWNKTTEPFYVVYNTDDELYQQHNDEVNQIVKVESHKIRTINFDPCGFNKITIGGPKDIFLGKRSELPSSMEERSKLSSTICVFEEKDPNLLDNTNTPFAIVCGDKDFAKKITIEIDGYTHGKSCRAKLNHADDKNVIPNSAVAGYSFRDQAWFKDKKYTVTTNGNKVIFSTDVYYPYHFAPYKDGQYPLKYFLLGLIDPFKLAIPLSTCRYERILFIDVYPDIEWEVAFLITIGKSYSQKITFKRESLEGYHKRFGFKMIKDDLKVEESLEGGLSRALNIKYSINDNTHNNQFQFGFVNTLEKIEYSYNKVSKWLETFNGVNNKKPSAAISKGIVRIFSFNIEPPNLAFALKWKWDVAKKNNQPVIAYTGGVALKPLIGVTISVDLVTIVSTFGGIVGEIIKWIIDFIEWVTDADLYIMFDISTELIGEIGLSYNKIDGFDPNIKKKAELELGCTLKAGIKSNDTVLVAITTASGESKQEEMEKWKLEGLVQTSVTFSKEYGYDSEKGSYHITDITWNGAEMTITIIMLAVKRGSVMPEDHGQKTFPILDAENIYNSEKIYDTDEK